MSYHLGYSHEWRKPIGIRLRLGRDYKLSRGLRKAKLHTEFIPISKRAIEALKEDRIYERIVAELEGEMVYLRCCIRNEFEY